MIILDSILKIITLYTTILGICFLIPRKKKPVAVPKTRFAILIAARNEENVIGALIKSLIEQNYPKELFDIIVIPNNCTDNTELVARNAGAKILNCTAAVKTKGEVLHFAFDELMGKYDAYCIFDADNIVDADFLARMNDVVCAGGRVAKSRQCALNPYDNWVSGCYDLHFQSINLLYSRGRAPFPLSAKLVGTGFMVTDELMKELGGWNTVTLTEDLEFAAQCAEIGVQIHYVPEALTYDEEPVSLKTSLRQRRRWSAGIQSVANRYAGRLIFKRPSWLRWDLAIHLITIYVQLLSLFPAFYCFLKLNPEAMPMVIVIALISSFIGLIAMAIFLVITAKRSVLKMWKAILMYPLFIASWYPIHICALIWKPKSWKPIEHGTAKGRQDVCKILNIN